MGRKTKIAIVTGVVVVLLGAGGRLRLRQLPEGQDRRRRDDRRRRRRRHERRRSAGAPSEPSCSPRSSHSLKVAYDGESWKLRGKSLKIHADLDGAVEEALDASQDGGLPGRLVRYVTGGERRRADPRRHHLLAAGGQPVRPQGRRGDRPRTAGRRRSTRAATRSKSCPPSTAASCATTCSPRRSTPPSSTPTPTTRSPPERHSTKPEVHGERSRRRVPVLPHPRPRHLHAAPLEAPEAGQDLHRRGRAWKAWKPRKGSTTSRKRKKTRPGTCPNPPGPARSPGRSIPPGPENPIKARWMGIFEGAGIHGTEET